MGDAWVWRRQQAVCILLTEAANSDFGNRSIPFALICGFSMSVTPRGMSVQEAYREYTDGSFRVNRQYQRK
jgi:hypothetical protein